MIDHHLAGSSNFGALLRHLRLRAGLTQSELGARVSYSDAQINRLERGVRLPDPDVVAARFIPALDLHKDVEAASRLLALARLEPNAPALGAGGMARPTDGLAPPALPSITTALIGREDTLAKLVSLHNQHRLLTLIGPPGIGKTRLALALTAELISKDMSDTAFVFIPLAAVRDSRQIPEAILKGLGINSMSQQSLEQLTHVLSCRSVVLVLDNLEQLVDDANAAMTVSIFAGLLASAPKLRMIVTSRTRLRISHEYVFDVPPLSLGAAYDLFIDRAKAHAPGFRMRDGDAAVIAEICLRLDYLPLGIELAAARIRIFDPPALLKRLRMPLDVLNNGPLDLPTRQRTLRSAIEWSYRLLTTDEQLLFRRLAVFADGCTMAMIEVVSAEGLSLPVVDVVQSLVDKSLLQASRFNHTIRFRYLEFVRVYAAERLAESVEADHIAEAAAQWFVDQVESAQHDLQVCESLAWFEWVDAESNNLREVILWSMRTGKVEYGMRLAAHLGEIWRFHGPLRDGAQLIADLLAHPNARRHLRLYGQVLLAGASLAYGGGSIAQTEHYGLEAQRIFESLGDRQLTGRALARLAPAANMSGQSATALELISTSCLLAASTDDKYGLAAALVLKGCFTNDPKVALRHFAEAYTLATTVHSAMGAFFGRWLQYACLLKLDKLDAAKASLEQALEMGIALGMTSSTYSVHGGLCQIAIYRGDTEKALAHGRHAVEGSTRHGSAYMRGLNLSVLGLAEHLCGFSESGEAMLHEALELHRRYGRHMLIPGCLFNLACIAADTGRYARAIRLFAAAEAQCATHDQEMFPAEVRFCAPRIKASMMNLTPAELQACRGDGAAMNLDTAVAFALTTA